MATKYQVSSTNLENVPIIDSQQCCVNMPTSKPCGHETSKYEESMSIRSYWSFLEHYKLMFLIGTLILVLVTCFSISMVYLALTSEIRIDFANHVDSNAKDSISQRRVANGNSCTNAEDFFFDDLAQDAYREMYTLLSESDGNRLKRETAPEMRLCKRNVQHCKSVMKSMKRIVDIVNNSMPHLQALSKNLSTNGAESKSEFMDLLQCLECKKLQTNDQITFIDESGPDRIINDNRLTHDQSSHLKIQSNMETVNHLLDNNHQEGTKNSTVIDTSSIFADAKGIRLNSSVVDDKDKDKEILDAKVTNIPEASSTIKTEYQSISAGADEINATTSTSTTFKTGMSNVFDVPTEPAISIGVTTKQEDNVTGVTSGEKHPSVHPFIHGHTEVETESGSGSEEEAANDTKTAKDSDSRSSFKERIVYNNYIQAKGNMEPSQVMVPTAETIKSTQQLQLTPTMSWMPYQVCFYGPPPNGVKSSAGQVIYPASSPGAPYPTVYPSMPRGPTFPGNHPVPNYVQVQAQSVQFMPMQGYPGNPGVPVGQRVGPTGPGSQNFPAFSGQQSPSGGGSNKSPYYCTYIPAPTFQFPAIPGVSEYQRSSENSKEGRTSENYKEGRASEKTWNMQKPSFPGYSRWCPFNLIQCTDRSTCISRKQWCDGHVDCNDASDETTCSCRDRISKERLCDGYFDCPHGEDELGCLGCPKTSFSCDDWNKRYTDGNCVPLSQRCDGIKQCANGKDEMDCTILTPTYIEGKNVFTIGYAQGYLHRNLGGQWYPACTGNTSWAMDACMSEIGPDAKGMPEIKVHAIPENAYKGFYLAEVNGVTKLVPTCMNTAVYVRCSEIPCGTRVLSSLDTSRSYNIIEDSDGLFKRNDMSPANNMKNSIDDESNLKKENDTLVGSELRVVGGRASHPKAWPFLIAIYKDGNFHCGGVILSELWILTAAHCLEGYANHYYEVQAGMLRRFSFSPMAQSRKARYTIVHPQYDNEDMKNDIAMVMLDTPLHFNRWVRPVCLPQAKIIGDMWRRTPTPETTCIATGWGATRERGPDPDHLREVEVPILRNCKHLSDQNDATICAGYPQGGRDACQGDSGGPLMCRNPYLDSQWYVAGIVSHGEGCGRPNEPGVYTKVSYFVNWIQEVSKNKNLPPFKRAPLDRCPGFSCNGGLGKCLPIEKRCDKMVDCLDGEDEIKCPGQVDYSVYRRAGADSEIIKRVDTNFVDTTPADVNSTDTTPAEVLDKDTASNVISDSSTDREPQKDTEKSFTAEDKNKTYIYNITDDDSSTKSSETEAPTFIFSCAKLLQTISIEQRCDRIVQCEDGTDEVNCTCKDFLSNLRPTAICDGYLDCDDKTDEENCKICGEDEFLCRRSKTCIPKSKKCDGKFDCPLTEDELDCFTLTDGNHVYLDADERPVLKMNGVLTRYYSGKWRPSCHRPKIYQNQSTIVVIGENMCEYFGFTGALSSEKVNVSDAELETIEWNKENGIHHENPWPGEEKTCSGISIHCRPVLNGSVNTRLVVPRTGSDSYLWPWMAAIFIDGHYRCDALLLDHNWLLSNTKCIENVIWNKNYTTALVGYSPSYRYVNGPHQQVSIVDDVKLVKNSVSILLHLRTPINITHHVQPLFLDKKIYPAAAEDICVAVGTNENFETTSIFLQPVLQNCQACHRCFINASIPECSENETSDWSGTVFCRGKKGWHPAATFVDKNGPCSFANVQSLTSIEYMNPHMMDAIEDDLRTWVEPSCDGFRCTIGKCISQKEICDGVPNCRGAEDEDPKYCEKIRASCNNTVDGCQCSKSQLRCGNGECVEKSAFCDGNIDCPDRSDEPTNCTCREYLKLAAPERLCDGTRHCFDKTDESPEFCPCKDTMFKCRTSTGSDICIPQDFICDGNNDCPDGEDETKCRMLKQSANDSSTSGEVIRRDFGVWHTECFSAPIQSEKEASDLCKTLGFASGNIRNNTETLDEPVLPSRDQFYMVRLNPWTWITMRDDKPLITLVKSREICHRAFVSCVEHTL